LINLRTERIIAKSESSRNEYIFNYKSSVFANSTVGNVVFVGNGKFNQAANSISEASRQDDFSIMMAKIIL